MKQPYTSVSPRAWLAAAVGALSLCGGLLGSAPVQAQTIKVEAEAGVLTGTAMIANTVTPFSGTGYVKFDQTGTLALTVPVTATQGAGAYDMIIRYETEFGFKLVDLRVNAPATDPAQTRYLNSTMTSGGFRSTANSRYNLTVGNNTVVFTASYGYHGIDYVQFVKAPAAVVPLVPSATGRVEAEAGIVYGAQSLLVDGGAGQSGTAYVANFVTPTDNVTLPITVATAGQYRIVVGARQEFNDKAYTIAVNGSAPVSVNIPNALTSTAATAPFGATQGGTFALTAGVNTIVIGGQGGYFSIDYVDLIASTSTAVKAGTNGLSGISVFPNPATENQLNVSLNVVSSQNAEVVLLNSVGRRVLARAQALRAGANEFVVPTNALANGIYQLVIYANNQPSATQRVVVLK